MGFVLPIAVAAIGVWIAFSIVVWATGRDTLLDLSPTGAPPGLGEGEPVSEAAIASVKFDTGLRGYRTGQVDAALTRLAWEIGRKDEQIAVLQSKLDGTYAEPASPVEDREAPATEPIAAPSDEDATIGETTPEALLETDPEAAGSEAEREESGEATPRGEA
ncbi:DivIVA domain-containing protein [Glycomyces sp. NRRL B-16210]|uniref:DivIVA domain-containing protein n=1 Tax=Glycomyces sp. NRRL B-16210 TaxID=1463821 RepID=UPI00068F6EE6|nr:DivIVA domain-containing protein [Glycomyces sp. NRRL B-16210]